VAAEALRWADPASEEFDEPSVRFIISEVNSKFEQAKRPNP
jgi:hypothetical protein